MRHYTREEWLAYKKGLTDMNLTMEQHLHDCAQCKKVFLELIDEAEISRAGKIIPGGFSTSAMQYIKHQQTKRKPPGYEKNQRRKLLSYYAIAAVITLILVNQGFFQLTVTGVSKAPNIYTEQKHDMSKEFIFNWPMRLAQKSTDLTKMIPSVINLKEVLR